MNEDGIRTMTCRDNTIKELLPLYAAGDLDEAAAGLIQAHLSSCPDCQSELALLQALASEPVPDPGQVFWDTMPARVFQAVQKQKTMRKGLDFSWLLAPLRLPRWAWAAPSLIVVFLVSWIIVISGVRMDRDDTDYQDTALLNSADTSGTVSMTELSGSDLDTLNDWAGQKLTQIAREAQSVAPSTPLLDLPDDMYEELADMSAPEMDRLNGILTAYDEEV